MDFLNPNLSILLPGQLTQVHRSAVWDKVILKESQWFTVNYNYASAVMKDVMRNYKKYELNALKLSEINKSKFSHTRMTEQFEVILDKYTSNIPTEVPMSLPGLPSGLPKLKKKTSSTNQITLPKLTEKTVEKGNINVNAEEPAAGSGKDSDNDLDKIKLPELILMGSTGDKNDNEENIDG